MRTRTRRRRTSALMLLSISLAILTAALVLPQSGAARFRSVKRRFSHTVAIMIIPKITNAEGSRCTGFVIAPGYVLTAGHCTSRVGERVMVNYINGESLIFVVKKRLVKNEEDSSGDLALLEGYTGSLSSIKLGTHSKKARTWCTAIGYGGPIAIQQATMCRADIKIEEGGLLGAIGEMDHGDSGGPVVDGKGLLIGMVDRITAPTSPGSEPPPVFYMVPSEDIRSFVKGVVSLP